MLQAAIIGEKHTIDRINASVPTIRAQLRREIERLAIKLLTHVKSDKLSGQVLNVRTGRLRRSINERVEDKNGDITGFVGTNVEYARIHEFGWRGTVTVKEHLRLINGKSSIVRSHTRNVKIQERSFLRSALADMASEIREGIRVAAVQGARKA